MSPQRLPVAAPLMLLLWLVPAGLMGRAARAQSVVLEAARVAELLPVPGISSNNVTNLEAEGDTLWVGPFLDLTDDGGLTWQVAGADSLQGTRNRTFSIDVEGATVWIGLGYNSREVNAGQVSSVATAGGFLVSEDGGRTFTYRPPQLDQPDDTLETYGVSTLPALPVIVPQQSPPYDIDFDPLTGDVWMAGWASGIRRSTDGGLTWQRVVLPPDNLDAIDPASPYTFSVEPQRGPNGWLNYLGFSVLVDETGTVWAGTPAGVNRSRPEDVNAAGERAWRRFSRDGTAASLTGNWVISIEEQPQAGRNPIWMASWNAGEAGEQGRFGITVTRDGGETFEQVLLGERIYDFAFEGERVYAAGEEGLFISDDGGATWNTIRDFRDPAQPDRIVRPDVNVFSVATVGDAVWVGTSDGLFKSSDGGATWQIFRTEVPVNPEVPTEQTPRVETYAYPNPFSPAIDRLVRIRYDLGQAQNVEVRVFDFGMNLVRRLVDGEQAQGAREVSWDGTDDGGLRVANGTYFYAVGTGADTFWGKILLIE